MWIKSRIKVYKILITYYYTVFGCYDVTTLHVILLESYRVGMYHDVVFFYMCPNFRIVINPRLFN